jgi:molybdopterin-guanine dinucleotide biosynthesis adapter protein
MVTPVIFQVVGFQNSGKTTFLNHLLELLSEEDIRTGIIKHHGHGGKPEVNEKKDSAKYSKKGAIASLVEGEGRLVIQAEKPKWSLEEQLTILVSFHLDVILIEGHKYEDFSKAVIIRNETDLFLINNLKNVVCVLFRDEALRKQVEENISVPSFDINYSNPYNWIIHFLKSQLHSSGFYKKP